MEIIHGDNEYTIAYTDYMQLFTESTYNTLWLHFLETKLLAIMTVIL